MSNLIISIRKWIKDHKLISIIIILLVSAGCAFAINPNFFKKLVKYDNLPNGTYSCELKIDSVSLFSEEGTKLFFERAMLILTDEEKSKIKDYKIEDYPEEFRLFQSSHIVKKDNIIKLTITNGEKSIDFLSCDIKDKKFLLNDAFKASFSEEKFNKIINVKQTRNSITFDNFGFFLIYLPQSYAEANGVNQTNKINLDHIVNLGDLVCRNKVGADNTKKEENISFDAESIYKDIIDSYSSYLYSYGKSGEILLGTPGWHNIENMSDVYNNCNSPYIGDQLSCEIFDNIRVHLAYTLYDMDGDNIEELIVAKHGSYYDDGGSAHLSNEIMAIYYYDKKVKNLYLAPANPGWGPIINILEDGYLKYSYGHQDSQSFNFQKKVKNWDKLELVLGYDFSGSYGSNNTVYNLTKTVPGKKDEIHNNITWNTWSDLEKKSSYDLVGKADINLNTLEWVPLIEIGGGE